MYQPSGENESALLAEVDSELESNIELGVESEEEIENDQE